MAKRAVAILTRFVRHDPLVSTSVPSPDVLEAFSQRERLFKGSFNPYDPADELYGEKLRQERMLHSMRHRKQWMGLYRSQHGLCVA